MISTQQQQQYPSLSEFKDELLPKLTKLSEHIGKDLITFIHSIVNQIDDTNENAPPKLKYDNTKNDSFSSTYSQAQKFLNDTSSMNYVLVETILLFKALKVSILNKNQNESQQALTYINERINIINNMDNTKNEIIIPYINILFTFESAVIAHYPSINECLLKFEKSQNKFILNHTLNNDVLYFNTTTNPELLAPFILNPLAFVHYLEYSIDLSFTFVNDVASVLSQYIKCLHLIMLFFEFKGNSKYNEIINTFTKAFIALSVEIVLKNKNDISNNNKLCLYSTLLKISYELVNIKSKEVYIFALLALLILTSCLSAVSDGGDNNNNVSHMLINMFNTVITSSKKPNVHLDYLIKEMKTNVNINNVDVIQVLLLGSLNKVLYQKYNKNFKEITDSLRYINIDDFLICDMFMYTSVYDKVTSTIKNFKQKLFWNYSEICRNLYLKKYEAPKIFKQSLLNQIQYVPDSKALLFYLAQYYYSNHNYRKTKMLLQKLLSNLIYIGDNPSQTFDEAIIDNNNQINFEIDTSALFMASRISILEEKYTQAKDYAVLNIQRLEKESETNNTSIQVNTNFRSRANFFLGLAYSKIAKTSLNSDDKYYYNELAKKYFEVANKVIEAKDKENLDYRYNYAYHLILLRRYVEASEYLSKCDEKSKNINISHLKILIKICSMHYQEALEEAKTVIKNVSKDTNAIFLNRIYLLYYYIKFYLLISYPSQQPEKERHTLITKFINVFKDIITAIEKCEKNNTERNSNKLDQQMKSLLMKVNNLETDKQSKHFSICKSNNKYELKYLQNFKIEFIKNTFLILDYLVDSKYFTSLSDNNFITLLKELENNSAGLSHEDNNSVLILALKAKLNNDFEKAESLFKKYVNNKPYDILGLKLYAKLLLDKKTNLSCVYTYCMNALKIDDTERDLWDILAQYYINQGEHVKYYECTMKEIANAKYHKTAFLYELMPQDLL